MLRLSLLTVLVLGLSVAIAHASAPTFETRVAMRDGVALYTRVYLPATENPVPTLVLRTPYDLPTAPPGGLAPDDADDEALEAAWEPIIASGYAVVMQNIRGTQTSEGRHEVFRTDAADGYDLLEWITQQPWSNGRVGALGDSAAGFAAYLMAAARPPALKAIFTQASCGNLWNGAILPENGGLKWETFLPWMLEQSLQASDSHIVSLGLSDTEVEIAQGQVLATLEALFGDDPVAQQSAWLQQPVIRYPGVSQLMPRWAEVLDPNAYADLVADYDTRTHIDVPMMQVTLWQDLFADCTLDVFQAVQARRGDQKLLVLNGSHYDIDDPAIWPFQPLLDWFDWHLKGRSTPAADWPAVQYVSQTSAAPQDNAMLLSAEAWPPQATRQRIFYLHNQRNGKLLERVPNSLRSQTLVANPQQPQATNGGRNLLIDAGALEQPESVRNTDDSLLYTSQRLRDGLLIAGPVELELYVTSENPDVSFFAKLIELMPDGRRVLIVDNMIRARFRDGRLTQQLLETDEIYPFNLELGHIAHTVAPGSRLQLEITGSNFPAWDLNPNSDAPLFEADVRQTARSEIKSGPGMLSALTLPVIVPLEDQDRWPLFKRQRLPYSMLLGSRNGMLDAHD